MQIATKEHFKHSWQVHDLLSDFEVEDVWQFPVKLKKEHNIALFQDQLFSGLEQLSQKGVAGLLFKLRFFLGKIFQLDKPTGSTSQAIKKGSIRERYAKKFSLTKNELIPIGNAEFEPVYVLEKESLAEIKNETVHAGLHLAKVPLNDQDYTVQMAVYVKPKGAFGRFYMALIKPFRLAIVYPAMMKLVGKHWKKYLQSRHFSN